MDLIKNLQFCCSSLSCPECRAFCSIDSFRRLFFKTESDVVIKKSRDEADAEIRALRESLQVEAEIRQEMNKESKKDKAKIKELLEAKVAGNSTNENEESNVQDQGPITFDLTESDDGAEVERKSTAGSNFTSNNIKVLSEFMLKPSQSTDVLLKPSQLSDVLIKPWHQIVKPSSTDILIPSLKHKMPEAPGAVGGASIPKTPKQE